MQYPTIMQPTSARIEQIPPGAADSADDSSQVFPPLSPSIPRNFTVIDTYYENPPAGISATSYDSRSAALTNTGPDSNFLAPFRGLGAVGDDVKDCLPADCREAFEAALAHETDWHSVRDISYTTLPSRLAATPPFQSRAQSRRGAVETRFRQASCAHFPVVICPSLHRSFGLSQSTASTSLTWLLNVQKWGSEASTKSRRAPTIDQAIVPYSVAR